MAIVKKTPAKKAAAAKTKAAAPAAQPVVEAKPAKARPATDAFGCRLGTAAARINEHFGKTPKTTAEVAEATGLPSARIRHHVRHHVARGNLVETDKGIVAAPKK